MRGPDKYFGVRGALEGSESVRDGDVGLRFCALAGSQRYSEIPRMTPTIPSVHRNGLCDDAGVISGSFMRHIPVIELQIKSAQ